MEKRIKNKKTNIENRIYKVYTDRGGNTVTDIPKSTLGKGKTIYMFPIRPLLYHIEDLKEELTWIVDPDEYAQVEHTVNYLIQMLEDYGYVRKYTMVKHNIKDRVKKQYK